MSTRPDRWRGPRRGRWWRSTRVTRQRPRRRSGTTSRRPVRARAGGSCRSRRGRSRRFRDGDTFTFPARLADFHAWAGVTDRDVPWLDDDTRALHVEWEHRRWDLRCTNPRCGTRSIRSRPSSTPRSRRCVRRPCSRRTRSTIPCALRAPRAHHHGVPVVGLIERSPFESIWFERDGLFAESAIWRSDSPWRAVADAEPTGRDVVERLRRNPAGFRSNEVTSSRPDLGGLRAPVVFLPLDNVLWTGWLPDGHPQGATDYPILRSPAAALELIGTWVDRLGGTLLVKPHPSCVEASRLCLPPAWASRRRVARRDPRRHRPHGGVQHEGRVRVARGGGPYRDPCRQSGCRRRRHRSLVGLRHAGGHDDGRARRPAASRPIASSTSSVDSNGATSTAFARGSRRRPPATWSWTSCGGPPRRCSAPTTPTRPTSSHAGSTAPAGASSRYTSGARCDASSSLPIDSSTRTTRCRASPATDGSWWPVSTTTPAWSCTSWSGNRRWVGIAAPSRCSIDFVAGSAVVCVTVAASQGHDAALDHLGRLGPADVVHSIHLPLPPLEATGDAAACAHGPRRAPPRPARPPCWTGSADHRTHRRLDRRGT